MLPNAITTARSPHLSAEAERDPFIARRGARWRGPWRSWSSRSAAAAADRGAAALPRSAVRRRRRPVRAALHRHPTDRGKRRIGTALLSIGRIRPLAVQVACTLAINLAALACSCRDSAPPGPLATVLCELAGLALLVHASRRELPGLIELVASPLRAGVAPRGATTQ